jgi:hypothetical protein
MGGLQLDLVEDFSANRSNILPVFSLCELCGLERSRVNGRVGERNILSAFIRVTSALIGGEKQTLINFTAQRFKLIYTIVVKR